MKLRLGMLATVLAVFMVAAATTAAQARVVKISEFRLSADRLAQLRSDWVDQLLATHATGTWAPMRMELTDRDLALMGLPPKRVLLAHRYRTPTEVRPDGTLVRLGTRNSSKGKGKPSGGSGGSSSTAVATFAGTGFFGIRPGAWLLLLNDNSVGWCSMAHVFGSPGAYRVSTAGHCGKVGDVATVVGVVGNRAPVLLDFGKFTSSTGDAGIGKDWALISVDAAYQSLVTPTMAFWGGPIGMYASTGEVVSWNPLGRNPVPTLNPNPALVQQIVHYGHGTGIGTGGTPRSGTAITWLPDHFSFFGAITPGDSGSGSNTLSGDAVGDNREAAGINTHIYVDPSLKTGLGIMAGTRATLVRAQLANGQLVPYPAPTPAPLP